jgi:DNA-binding PadR family transcriptional regulator
MKRASTSVLGYALLGLVQQRPSSGYDLRKIFAETAMGSYSSSPGAIYPALEKLEKRGLIRSVVEDSAGLRRRRVYTITANGVRGLEEWLARPIDRAVVVRGLQELMLRFAFMEDALGANSAIQLLRNLKSELKEYVPTLRTYLRYKGPEMPLSAMLALDSGIRNYDSLMRWTEHAIRTYEAAIAAGKSKPQKARK